VKKLENQRLIEQVINIYNNVECNLKFHKKSSRFIKLMRNNDFLSYIFEKNLVNKKFIKKKWKSFEVPKLTIYENENFSLHYHIFCPIKDYTSETAIYLIHDHQSYILSSYIFFGNGYKTIEFVKNIYHDQNKYQLLISKNFHHSNNSVNILDSHTPHVIFNVPTTTSSIVLWSKDQSKEDKFNNRINYYIENNKIKKIKDDGFIKKTESYENFEKDSEKHIQAICFLLQKNNYDKIKFLNQIIEDKSTNEKWKKWLSKLAEKTPISEPIFKKNLNTFNLDIHKNDIENLCNLKINKN